MFIFDEFWNGFNYRPHLHISRFRLILDRSIRRVLTTRTETKLMVEFDLTVMKWNEIGRNLKNSKLNVSSAVHSTDDSLSLLERNCRVNLFKFHDLVQEHGMENSEQYENETIIGF